MKRTVVQFPITLIILVCLIFTTLQGCTRRVMEEELTADHIVLAERPYDAGTLGQQTPGLTGTTPLPTVTDTPTNEIPDTTVPEKTPDKIASQDPKERLRITIGKTVKEQVKKAGAKEVNLALCLDTSGSMNVLIDSARRKLQDIAGDIAGLKPAPRLRVALLAYGSASFGAENGWVRIESDFTDDLNLIHVKLSNLRCGGNNEYVARSIKVATYNLHWSSSPVTLKTIFIAGNENTTQDPDIDITSACIDATQKGIIINTIYCGLKEDLDAREWEDLALLGRGKFTAISLSENVFSAGTPLSRHIKSAGAHTFKKPEKRGSLIPLQGTVTGIINNREIILKEITGSSSKTLSLCSTTKFSPSSWRPFTGEYVTAYVSISRPDVIKELDYLR